MEGPVGKSVATAVMGGDDGVCMVGMRRRVQRNPIHVP